MTGPSDDSTSGADADGDTSGLSTVERAAVEAARSAIQSATPWTGRLLHVSGRPETTAWLTAEGHDVCHLRIDTETTDASPETSSTPASLPAPVTVVETGLVVDRVVGLDSFLARLDGLDDERRVTAQ